MNLDRLRRQAEFEVKRDALQAEAINKIYALGDKLYKKKREEIDAIDDSLPEPFRTELFQYKQSAQSYTYNSALAFQVTVFVIVGILAFNQTTKFIYDMWAKFGHPFIDFNRFTAYDFIWWFALIPFGIVLSGRSGTHAIRAKRRSIYAKVSKFLAENETAPALAQSQPPKQPATSSASAAAAGVAAAAFAGAVGAAPAAKPIYPEASPVQRPPFTGLYIGTSTGRLASRANDRIPVFGSGQEVWLSAEDCYKAFLILGGTGGGKTSRAIAPFLAQLLQQDIGAFIFDIKGDFRKTVEYLAGLTGRSYRVVGDKAFTLPLFRGMSPEMIKHMLKSAFARAAQSSGKGDAFWVDTSTDYCGHLMWLIKLTGGNYSIAGLAELAFDDDMQKEKLLALTDLDEAGKLTEDESLIAASTTAYLTKIKNKWDDKLKSNVNTSLNQVLNPFTLPAFVKAFSSSSTENEVDLTDLINKGEVFLLNLPHAVYGKTTVDIAYTLIKLRFMTMMEDRCNHPEWADRPVLFMGDEYHKIVEKQLDADYWSTSRSTKTIGIVSMQGVSSLVEAVGSTDTADAILQNYRQRLLFRTEDLKSIIACKQLLGQIDVIHENQSYTDSGSSGVSRQGGMGGGSSSSNVSDSDGVSLSQTRQDLIDASDFRQLDADYALFIGNVGDRAFDEIVQVKPLYVPEPASVAVPA